MQLLQLFRAHYDDGFLYYNNITFQIHCKRLVFPTKADLRQQLWCQLHKLIPSDLKKMPKRLYLLPPPPSSLLLLSFILLWHHLQLSHSESKYLLKSARLPPILFVDIFYPNVITNVNF